MAIDTRFILAFPFEQYFVDKDSGLPLANGTVQFFQDTARTIPKSVYIISGSPPNYTYVDIGNVVSLDAVGVPNYLGTNVALYFYPYDSFLPGANIQLYYIEAFSSTNVLQFTREGIPNVALTGQIEQEFKNYIPNGQFLDHITIPANLPTYKVGQIRQASTPIAYGGWTFERPNLSTANDFVTFSRQNSITDLPVGYPRYVLNVVNTGVGAGDTFKDVTITFDDVNKFASSSQYFTFAISAISNGVAGFPVQLYLIKNFGLGGSPQSQTLLATFNVTTSWTIFQQQFIFGNNDLSTLGTDNTDSVQLAIRLPLNSQFSFSATDAILAFGQISVINFPPTPISEMQYESIAGFLPVNDPAGFDLYLPIKLTQTGLTYDDSCVGDLIDETQLITYVNSLHPTSNRMLGDGSQYSTTGYSPLGIPFARLQAKYWNPTLNIPQYGTGKNFFSAITYASNSSQLIINNNTGGPVTNASDGGTTFTIATIHKGRVNDVIAYNFGADEIYIRATVFGQGVTPSANTSGFTVLEQQQGTSILEEVVSVQFVIPGGGIAVLAGAYFTYGSGSTRYYVWYKVDGVGVDPAPATYTSVEVDLVSTDTLDTLTEKTRQAINGWQVTTVNTVSGGSVTNGTYFNIFSTTTQYYVWYKVNGVGTDPAVMGGTGIEVDILSSDSAAQVATKTQIAINMTNFAVPDVRGLFVRGFSGTNTLNDPESAKRFSLVPLIFGNLIGTFEYDQFEQHVHDFFTTGAGGGGTIQGGATLNDTTLSNTGQNGGYETRPRNFGANKVIIY